MTSSLLVVGVWILSFFGIVKRLHIIKLRILPLPQNVIEIFPQYSKKVSCLNIRNKHPLKKFSSIISSKSKWEETLKLVPHLSRWNWITKVICLCCHNVNKKFSCQIMLFLFTHFHITLDEYFFLLVPLQMPFCFLNIFIPIYWNTAANLKIIIVGSIYLTFITFWALLLTVDT